MKTVTFEIPDDVSVGYFMDYLCRASNYYHEVESDKAYDEGGEEHSNYVSETCDKIVSIVNLKSFEVAEWHEYQILQNMIRDTE